MGCVRDGGRLRLRVGSLVYPDSDASTLVEASQLGVCGDDLMGRASRMDLLAEAVYVSRAACSSQEMRSKQKEDPPEEIERSQWNRLSTIRGW